MKKIFSVFIALFAAFAFSVCTFAAKEPERYFILASTAQTPESVAAYAAEKGFDGIVLDLTGHADTEYYKELAKAAEGKTIYVCGDAVLLGKLPAEAKIIARPGLFEEDLAAFYEKHGKENIAAYMPFDENFSSYLPKISDWYEKGYISAVFTENILSSYSEYGYEEYNLYIANALSGAKLITVNDLNRVLMPVASGDFYGDAFELNNQYLVNKLNGFDFCVSDYSALLANKNASATVLTEYFGSTVLDEHADFSVSQKLEITRPTGSTLTVQTKKYSIFGTSNPEKPLYMNGEEIERISTNGTFAVTVEIPKSGKTFTFSQGGKSVSVTLKRSGGGGSTGTTSSLSSCYPTGATLVQPGKTEVTLSCIGPSGGKVTAEIAGKKVTLKQVAYADTGVPAKFSAKVDLAGNYPDDETTLIGKVTYRLSYKGAVKTKESAEGFYFVGSGSVFAVRAAVDLTGVEREPKDSGDYITTLRTGCVDFVTEVAENGWYKVSTGGYIKPEQCEIVTGKAQVIANLGTPNKEIAPDYEKLSFSCNVLPSFKGEIVGKALVLTLFNTEYQNLSAIDTSSNLMRRIVAVDNGDGSVTLNIYSNVKVWGWDIVTDAENNKFTVVMQTAPKLSDDPAKPLLGVTVTLCAGHGGADPGALGPTGETGVNEAQINRANIMASAEFLESLGATVQVIAVTEGKVGTYGKMDPAREICSDIYICSHANSVAESAEANLWCGTEVYYHYKESAVLSQKLVDYISAGTRRDNEGSIQSYYSVTRMTICPAVMLEVGFMNNPREYESLIDKRDIQKTALAVVRAVLEIVDEAN